jgi:hypothetical protein
VDNHHLTYRCKNGASHLKEGTQVDGNIVAFIGKNTIVVRCGDRKCRAWNVLKFQLPGIDLDLRQAGVTQTVIADPNIVFKSARAPVIIDEGQ